MSPAERSQLGELDQWLKEWRSEDKEWKERTELRLRSLEDERTAREAIAKDKANSSSDSRWKVGLLIGAVTSVVTIGSNIVLKVIFP